jgi:hypothetical protein
MRRILYSTALAFVLSSSAYAADTSTSDSEPWYVKEVKIVVGMLRAAGSAANTVWTDADKLVFGGSPYRYLPSQISEDDRQFFATLHALGLQLSEIQVGSSTFSQTSYRFVAAREPSDLDIERAQRKLDEYRATFGGLRAAAKQHIAQSILDIAEDKTYVLSAATVDLWPWPSVHYEISARDRPPEVAEHRMFDAAQK